MKKVSKLHIGPAGVPKDAEWKNYEEAIPNLTKNGLDAIEVEFVHGAKMNLERAEKIGKIAKKHRVVLTAHAPYYVNLNAIEKDKREKSKWRILKTAEILDTMGGYSVVFHPGYYLGMNKEDAYRNIERELKDLMKKVYTKGLDVWIRPELMGKPSQFGDLKEVVRLAENIEGVLPTIDFAHAHARNVGKCNTKEEWREMLSYIEDRLGREALDNMHIHLSDIEYTLKGEKRHVPLDGNTIKWRELIDVLKEFRVKGVIICESPQMYTDALKIAEHYRKKK